MTDDAKYYEILATGKYVVIKNEGCKLQLTIVEYINECIWGAVNIKAGLAAPFPMPSKWPGQVFEQ